MGWWRRWLRWWCPLLRSTREIPLSLSPSQSPNLLLHHPSFLTLSVSLPGSISSLKSPTTRWKVDNLVSSMDWIRSFGNMRTKSKRVVFICLFLPEGSDSSRDFGGNRAALEALYFLSSLQPQIRSWFRHSTRGISFYPFICMCLCFNLWFFQVIFWFITGNIDEWVGGFWIGGCGRCNVARSWKVKQQQCRVFVVPVDCFHLYLSVCLIIAGVFLTQSLVWLLFLLPLSCMTLRYFRFYMAFHYSFVWLSSFLICNLIIKGNYLFPFSTVIVDCLP